MNRFRTDRLGDGRGGLLLLLVLCVLALGTAYRVARTASDSSAATVRTVFVPTPPPPATVTDTLRRGQTLGEILGSYGLDGNQIERLVELIRPFEHPRRFRPGTVFHFALRAAQPPERISVELDADRRLFLVSDAVGVGWQVRLDSVPVRVDTIRVGGIVRTNLYDAEMWGEVSRLAAGEAEELVYRLAQIFAWQIDFYRDIRVGDWYRVAVEREVRPDGSLRSARILAAEFRNAGRELSAVRFVLEDGRAEYFDRDGEALRSQFLRSPIEFGRVTSGFSYRRYHPILKRRRPHLGTDYGAPVGTPVRATGAGAVTRAGWWGGYGRAVEIRHINGIRTRYAHLSRIARGIAAGRRVEQGQTIGFVGSSGLSTASHLHYEFLQHGRQRNPARLDLPRAEPVPVALRPRFEETRDAAFGLLARLPVPGGQLADDGTNPAVDRLAGETDD